jgi:hypothetical protein
LPADDPFRRTLLGDQDPKTAAAALHRDSQVGEKKIVEELLEGGAESVAECDDVAIRVARVLAPLTKKYDAEKNELETQERVHGVRIGQALFEIYGNKVSPDATFTLRLSDGIVKGFPYNGTVAPHKTTLYGLFDRCSSFGNLYPFDLPGIWQERKDQLDMTKAVNFVATNDIIGGNSGSPVINKNLEIVGLIFDGNIEMLPNRYVYTDAIPRSVAVHVEGIMEALRKIYDAEHVAEELLGERTY